MFITHIFVAMHKNCHEQLLNYIVAVYW